LVVDPYTASILNALKVLSPHLPQYDWDNSFKVYFVDNSYTQKMAKDFSLDKYRSAEISLTEIVNQQSRLVVKENYKISHVLKNEGLLVNTKLLYSMWDGYLKADNFWQTNNVPIIKIHTSGHAYKQDLIRLVEAINPVKVIPNHTFYPDEFKELFGSKSIVLKDGEILEC
jgi:ribonuclease J